MSTTPQSASFLARGTPIILRLVAELGIVIFGVMVALWADGKVSERHDRQIEAARLHALDGDLVRTQERLQKVKENAEGVASALREVVGYTYAKGEDAQVEKALQGGFFGMPEFYPELSVYDDLRSSGELALFSDAALRQALSTLQARVERLGVYQADLLSVQQLNVDPMLMRRFDLAGIKGNLAGLDETVSQEKFGAKIMDDVEIRNVALFKLDMVNTLQRRLGAVDSSLVAVRQLVQAQLQTE